MHKTAEKGRSERAFAGTPGALAFLVCESRARRSDLSHDRLSTQWIPDHLKSVVQSLYAAYVEQVYPLDSIVLACRNRFILQLIESSEEGAEIVIAPSGLVSYPYLARNNRTYTEIDFGEVVEYKSERADKLASIQSLPKRNVRYLSQDLAKITTHADVAEWFVGERTERIIILEGLSYYLTKSEWWGLVDTLFNELRAGDKLVFDIWPMSESSRAIYKRFLRFCNRFAGFNKEDFQFISLNELKAHFFTAVPNINVRTEVISVRDICLDLFDSDELQDAEILNDTIIIVAKEKI